MTVRRGQSARVLAQAKINLALHILDREPSGYHALETIFARLDLADEIVVRVDGAGRSIDCGGDAWREPVPAERNLAYRAALAYAEAAGWPDAFAIEIEKRIPIGGGLGGGSADAGAVLRALDALSAQPLGPDRLRALGAELGADVAFLAGDWPIALAWGHGEQMRPLAPLPASDVSLLVPPFPVATADAYRWLDESRGDRPSAARASLRTIAAKTSWEEMARIAHNDFDAVVGAHHPEIAECTAALRADGAAIALLSGSGSTVFGIWHAHHRARLAALPAEIRTLETRTSARVVPVAVTE